MIDPIGHIKTASANGPKPSPEKKFQLIHSGFYLDWRREKLAAYPKSAENLIVEVGNLRAPTSSETEAILANCARANMSFYKLSDSSGTGSDSTRADLQCFAQSLGLHTTEAHRSAAGDGIVALEVTSAKAQAGYIPYTKRRLSWHTDGYYNYHGPDNAIRAMLMHCARPALSGGENAYLDPEIVYIRLRDENPEFIEALMQPDVMTIPENREPDGTVRATNTGPVFFVDAIGRLAMRFTARTRNIIWKDDPVTTAAREFLSAVLSDDPLIIRYRLSAGEGVICNNVLHNRTGFDGDLEENSRRLLYRARYYEIIT